MTSTIAMIESGLGNLRSRYQHDAGALALLEKQQAEKQIELSQAKDNIEVWQQVQILLSKVSSFAREQLTKTIEETVAAALQFVFNDDRIGYKIDIRNINGKPAAEGYVVSPCGDAMITVNPEDGRGGGVSDVVSLALRLALLELSRPKPQGPVILDEIGKHVSAEFAPNVAMFLKQYAKRTGRQILLITHQTALADVADVSYRVSQANGVSEVTRG